MFDFPLNKVIPFVSSVGVCSAFEMLRIYIEVVPRQLTDVVREPFKYISHGRRSDDDAFRGEALHDSIIILEDIAFRLLGDVKSENLLFIFSETVQGLQDFLFEYSFSPPPLYPPCEFNADCDGQECTCEDKYDTEPRAIILCKVIDAQKLKDAFGCKKEKGKNKTNRYEITWSEFQELKKRF